MEMNPAAEHVKNEIKIPDVFVGCAKNGFAG